MLSVRACGALAARTARMFCTFARCAGWHTGDETHAGARACADWRSLLLLVMVVLMVLPLMVVSGTSV